MMRASCKNKKKVKLSRKVWRRHAQKAPRGWRWGEGGKELTMSKTTRAGRSVSRIKSLFGGAILSSFSFTPVLGERVKNRSTPDFVEKARMLRPPLRRGESYWGRAPYVCGRGLLQ